MISSKDLSFYIIYKAILENGSSFNEISNSCNSKCFLEFFKFRSYIIYAKQKPKSYKLF